MELITDKTAKLRETEFNQLKEELGINHNNLEVFTERLAQLELSLEDQGWDRVGSQTEKEFSRSGLTTINQMARYMWLKNPLIRRAVLTQTIYVTGQGVEINSENEDVNTVIQDFMDNPLNKVEITSQQTRAIKETELQLFANIFFVFFTNAQTGEVKVRTIPCDEIQEIITDPNDSKTTLFYKRVYNVREFDLKSESYSDGKSVTRYYNDWKSPDPKKGGKFDEAVVYHVAVNKLSDMKFGVSEVYAAMDWARAYKSFLEDWATITKSYAQFAWNLTAKNKTGMARAKSKLNTTLSSSNPESNPPAVTASIFTQTEGTKMEPIKTAGATTKADDGDKLVHMVSAATGIFYHYLVGDPSTGNLATAKAMERPMELMFRERQELWVTVYTDILNFVIDKSILATGGKLKGSRDPDKNIVLASKEERLINIKFPDLLEKDTVARIDAVIKAATLDGKNDAGVMEFKTVARLLLEALGETDIDEMLDKMFPDGKPIKPLAVQVEESFKELKEVIENQNRKLTKDDLKFIIDSEK